MMYILCCLQFIQGGIIIIVLPLTNLAILGYSACIHRIVGNYNNDDNQF